MQQARHHVVAERSMAPTLEPGDRFVSRRRPPRPGDIVVATSPTGQRVVKRVTAVGPARVVVGEGVVRVDGGPEPWEPVEATSGVGSWTVGVDEVFLLSDARHRTVADSRTWGPVPLADVDGVAVFRYLPLRRLGRP
jgi:signal peptidase I